MTFSPLCQRAPSTSHSHNKMSNNCYTGAALANINSFLFVFIAVLPGYWCWVTREKNFSLAFVCNMMNYCPCIKIWEFRNCKWPIFIVKFAVRIAINQLDINLLVIILKLFRSFLWDSGKFSILSKVELTCNELVFMRYWIYLREKKKHWFDIMLIS